MIIVKSKKFTPPALTMGGFLCWFESLNPNGNGVLPVNGTSLSSVANLINNSVTVTQTTGANQPVFTTNVLSGLPVIRFNGSSSYLSVGADISYTLVSNVTLFCLYQMRNGGSNDQGLWGNDNGVWDRFALLQHPTVTPGVSNGSGTFPVSAFNNVNTWQLCTVQYQQGVAGGSQVWINGTSIGTFQATQTTTGDSTLSIGRLGSSGQYGNIDVAVFGLTNFTLSASQLKQIHFDIYNRYGISGI